MHSTSKDSGAFEKDIQPQGRVACVSFVKISDSHKAKRGWPFVSLRRTTGS